MTPSNITPTTIFLAEDDEDDRMFFVDALKKVKQPTELVVAKDGIELMSELDSAVVLATPQVIFLDLNMPRKNGFECLKEIRRNPRLKDIPVVIFSTSGSSDAVDETYKAGATYYVCKPRSFPLLIKIIDTILQPGMCKFPQPAKENYLLAVA